MKRPEIFNEDGTHRYYTPEQWPSYEQGYKTAEEDFFNQYGGLINEHRK